MSNYVGRNMVATLMLGFETGMLGGIGSTGSGTSLNPTLRTYLGTDVVQIDANGNVLIGSNLLGYIPETIQYSATSVTNVIFVASGACRVKAIIGRPTVAGTDAGAVTASIYKAPSGTAIASGTILHTGTYNLKGTINTNQSLTVSTTASDLLLAAGDCVGVAYTGVMTAAVGAISVHVIPA